MTKIPNAGGSTLRIIIVALFSLVAGGCLHSAQDEKVVGSGTELGNVVGILVMPNQQPAVGVEVILYPLEKDSSYALKTITDSYGAFSFKVDSGTFRLLAFDSANNGATVDSLAPSTGKVINLPQTQMGPLGGLKGYIKTLPNSSSDLFLTLNGFPSTFLFPGNGEFLWQGIPAGTYTFAVREMSIGSVREVLVTILPGLITTLPDTIDLLSKTLSLSTLELPYQMQSYNGLFFQNGGEFDSVFWMVNGQRKENQFPYSSKTGEIVLTRDMLDTGISNDVQLLIHSNDSDFVLQKWIINLYSYHPKEFAYHAIQAVITDLKPDTRTAAIQRTNSSPAKLGTFRILQKRLLSPEELVYWDWNAYDNLDSTLPDEIQYPINNFKLAASTECRRMVEDTTQPYALGDTVTFILKPDSILGGIAFNLHTNERYQDISHLGYFAKADWPLGQFLRQFYGRSQVKVDLVPSGMEVNWMQTYFFIKTSVSIPNPVCLGTKHRYLLDSAGQVREIIACPLKINPSRLLLHYRWNISETIQTDSIPALGSYVYIDSSGMGVSQNSDSLRTFQVDPTSLQDLTTLLSGFPNPLPEVWFRDYLTHSTSSHSNEDFRYLVIDKRSVIELKGDPKTDPGKADFISSVENWLHAQNLY